MGVTPSSASTFEDFDRALESLEIVFRANGDSVELILDINWHRSKEVGERESVILRGAQTKDEGYECKLTKNMLFHRYLLGLCLKKKRKITYFFPDTTIFII